MTGAREEVDRSWDVERGPCMGCDYFHDKYHSSETDAKRHKEMDANIQALGWFWAQSGR
jgi:hypothetical protein